MFSAKTLMPAVLALAAAAYANAGPPDAVEPAVAVEQDPRVTTDSFVLHELDWRSYYLNRIDGTREGLPQRQAPRFRPGA